jgi:hydrogenase maturation protease
MATLLIKKLEKIDFSMSKVLIIGYGNPGRLDDGLGPAFAEAIQQYNINGVDTESNYQLTVEDAVDIAEHDIVIFADADVKGPEPFYFKKITPAAVVNLSSHSIKPKSLIGLVKESFNKEVEAYVLGIRGYEFNNFEEKLSEKAVANLNKAVDFIKPLLKNANFYEVRTESVIW